MRSHATLPSQMITDLINSEQVYGRLSRSNTTQPIRFSQIQPASLDLRLDTSYSRLAKSAIGFLRRNKWSSLPQQTQINPGEVCIVKLTERLALPVDISAQAHTRSSIGRLGVLVRLLTGAKVGYNVVPAGYHGELYAEIAPLVTPIIISPGSRLVQLQFRESLPGKPPSTSVTMCADLRGETPAVWQLSEGQFQAIDLDWAGRYPLSDFLTPIGNLNSRQVVLPRPGNLYLVRTKRKVDIGPDACAVARPYNKEFGEFRSHFAGFFDPGFHCKAVLGIRSPDLPMQLLDGQPISTLDYEPLLEPSDKLYGKAIGSSYCEDNNLMLGKYFYDDRR